MRISISLSSDNSPLTTEPKSDALLTLLYLRMLRILSLISDTWSFILRHPIFLINRYILYIFKGLPAVSIAYLNPTYFFNAVCTNSLSVRLILLPIPPRDELGGPAATFGLIRRFDMISRPAGLDVQRRVQSEYHHRQAVIDLCPGWLADA